MRLLKIISPWLFGIWLTCYGLLAKSQPTQGTISGRVTNASGEPVIGATLLLEPNGPGTVADTLGRYELPELEQLIQQSQSDGLTDTTYQAVYTGICT